MVAAIGLTSSAFAHYDDCCCDNNGPFDGFYVGGNLGWATHEATRFGGLVDLQNTGFVGGVQAGRDWQCGSFVYGLVWDFDGAANDHRHRGWNSSNDLSSFKVGVDWFTTIRARAGLAVCDTLLYLTAGAIGAHAESKASFDDINFFHKDSTRWGWIGGSGLEYKVCDNWTVGGDLTYAFFDSWGRNNDDYSNFGNHDSIWAARIIFNYRIDDLCCPW